MVDRLLTTSVWKVKDIGGKRSLHDGCLSPPSAWVDLAAYRWLSGIERKLVAMREDYQSLHACLPVFHYEMAARRIR